MKKNKRTRARELYYFIASCLYRYNRRGLQVRDVSVTFFILVSRASIYHRRCAINFAVVTHQMQLAMQPGKPRRTCVACAMHRFRLSFARNRNTKLSSIEMSTTDVT